MQKLILLATLFAASVFATNDNSCSQSVSTDAGQVNVTIVEVGNVNGSLRYFPDDIQVAPGNIVQFNFNPKNHTVTESSFAAPCQHLAANLTSATRPGVRSGFVPVTGDEQLQPAFRIIVNDTKPIWLYCGQTKHCQNGMVMVINQNRSDTTLKTLDAFRANAAQVPLDSAGAPAAPPPAGASSSMAAPPAAYSTASAPPAAVTPAPPPTTTSAANSAGPVLSASSTVAASSPIISVFNGRAPTKDSPTRFVAVGGVAAVFGAVVLL